MAIPTPGHTGGHCSFVVDGVLVSGDALVTGHPLSTRSGRSCCRLFNHDQDGCVRSLAALGMLDTDVLLPGHGPVWRGSIREAVAEAQGASGGRNASWPLISRLSSAESIIPGPAEGSEMTAAAIACASCGAMPARAGARYCDACGARSPTRTSHAEFKQVTVLFADVVDSMDIAAAVGAERLREIMAGLVGRGAAVVQRYGGTIDQFTGDGLMAVFGAPVALEDHAIRACLAALGMQSETQRLADEVNDRDGIELQSARGPEFWSGRSPVKSVRAYRVTPRSASRSGWRSGWSRWPRRAA